MPMGWGRGVVLQYASAMLANHVDGRLLEALRCVPLSGARGSLGLCGARDVLRSTLMQPRRAVHRAWLRARACGRDTRGAARTRARARARKHGAQGRRGRWRLQPRQLAVPRGIRCAARTRGGATYNRTPVVQRSAAVFLFRCRRSIGLRRPRGRRPKRSRCAPLRESTPVREHARPR
jgi:hypothetical protein